MPKKKINALCTKTRVTFLFGKFFFLLFLYIIEKKQIKPVHLTPIKRIKRKADKTVHLTPIKRIKREAEKA